MTSPELFVEFGVLHENLAGRLAFEVLGDLGDGNLGWHGDEEVDVVFGDMAAYDLHVVRHTDFSDQITHTDTQSPREDGLLVFGGPHQMIFQVKDRVRT